MADLEKLRRNIQELLNDNLNISIHACDGCGEIICRWFDDDYSEPEGERNLEKLKKIERQLTLMRDDLRGYGEFVTRNIKQSKEIVSWEKSHKELIETIESLDYRTDTEKEREGLKLKIINIIKGVKPNSSHD